MKQKNNFSVGTNTTRNEKWYEKNKEISNKNLIKTRKRKISMAL